MGIWERILGSHFGVSASQIGRSLLTPFFLGAGWPCKPIPRKFQKNPRVRKIRVRNSGAGNGRANFMDAWKKCVRSAGKTMSIKFLVLGGGILDFWGGGVPILFLWARGFFWKLPQIYEAARKNGRESARPEEPGLAPKVLQNPRGVLQNFSSISSLLCKNVLQDPSFEDRLFFLPKKRTLKKRFRTLRHLNLGSLTPKFGEYGLTREYLTLIFRIFPRVVGKSQLVLASLHCDSGGCMGCPAKPVLEGSESGIDLLCVRSL